MSALQGYKISPAGLEPLQVLEKEKSYCENTKNPATSFPFFDPIYHQDYTLISDFFFFFSIPLSMLVKLNPLLSGIIQEP